MMTLIAAAAAAVAQPATPAPAAPAAQHKQMGMSHTGQHEGMGCCKDCCEHMADKVEGHTSDHPAPSSR